MKRILSLLLISAILTGCGHISDDSPDVAEETTTASQITETIASDTTEAVTSDVAVTNEVTTVNSSQSVTDITTTAAGNTNGEPKKENKKTQNSQDHNAQEVKQNENKTTTPVQTPPQRAESPAVTENKATQAVRTTTPVVTTALPITIQAQPTTEKATEPVKMNITDHWLIYFSDGHDKEYYVNIGRNLPNDGSDNCKVQAVFDYVTSNFSDDTACTYLSAITMSLCEGIGLDCGYALMSNWYDHCANAVKVDGNWYA